MPAQFEKYACVDYLIQGALVMKAIELAMDRHDAVGARPDGRPDDDEKTDNDPDVTAETREPFPARRADALAETAESYLNSEPMSASTADRYQVVVHVTAETLKDKADVTAETSTEKVE